MKRLVTLMSSAVMFISLFATPVTQVSAATVNTPPANTAQVSANTSQFSKAEINKISEAINGSLTVVKTPAGVLQVKIVNRNYLDNSLKKANTGLTAQDVTNVVDKLNLYIRSHHSEFNNSDDNPLLRKKKSGLCSAALGFIGLVHSGAYSAAAYLLGVTGPEAVIIPIVVGAVYYAGSLFC